MLYGEKKVQHMARNAFKGHKSKSAKSIKKLEKRARRHAVNQQTKQAIYDANIDIDTFNYPGTYEYLEYRCCYFSRQFVHWFEKHFKDEAADTKHDFLIAQAPMIRWWALNYLSGINPRMPDLWSERHRLKTTSPWLCHGVQVEFLNWISNNGLISVFNHYMKMHDSTFTHEEAKAIGQAFTGNVEKYLNALSDRSNWRKMVSIQKLFYPDSKLRFGWEPRTYWGVPGFHSHAIVDIFHRAVESWYVNSWEYGEACQFLHSTKKLYFRQALYL